MTRRHDSDPVLTIENFSVDYLGERTVHAVKNVTLSLGRGEILGLAGESGCGKSTLAYGVARLLKLPGMVTSGTAEFHSREGQTIDLRALAGEDLRAFRWNKMSMVFQGAMNSLNPVINIRAQMEDIFTTHRPEIDKDERRKLCGDLLERVGVDRSRLRSFPHELSGGMRQRVMIAMAMALDPQVLIMDEPTTALDVVMQRQIVEQIAELRERLGFSVIFITHDVSLLIEIADRIAIMYAGEIVEDAPAQDVYRRPRHPYSRALLHSFPPLRGALRELTGIPGSPPDILSLPPGCPFEPRCAFAVDRCAVEHPRLGPTAFGEKGRSVSCLLHDDATTLPVELAQR